MMVVVRSRRLVTEVMAPSLQCAKYLYKTFRRHYCCSIVPTVDCVTEYIHRSESSFALY